MNGRFHSLIVREARSAMIEQAIDRNGRIPFTGPQALAFDRPASTTCTRGSHIRIGSITTSSMRSRTAKDHEWKR